MRNSTLRGEMESLPTEIHQEIITLLRVQDAGKLMQCNRRFRKVVAGNAVFKEKKSMVCKRWHWIEISPIKITTIHKMQTPLPELSEYVNNGGQEEDWLDMQESEDISHLMPELMESIKKTLTREHGPDPFAKYVVFIDQPIGEKSNSNEVQ